MLSKKPLPQSMHMVIFIIVGALLVVMLSFFQLPKWLVYALIMTASLSYFAIYPLYIMYRSNHLPTIEKYVIQNRRKPLFKAVYALTRNDGDAYESALVEIIQKYPKPSIRLIYEANLALYQKQYEHMLNVAQQIPKPSYRYYFSGLAYCMLNELELAEQTIQQLDTPWMKHSLRASIAQKKLDQWCFDKEAQAAIHTASGLQKLITYHYVENKRKEMRDHQ